MDEREAKKKGWLVQCKKSRSERHRVRIEVKNVRIDLARRNVRVCTSEGFQRWWCEGSRIPRAGE